MCTPAHRPFPRGIGVSPVLQRAKTDSGDIYQFFNFIKIESEALVMGKITLFL
jgi:hypothetical protein